MPRPQPVIEADARSSRRSCKTPGGRAQALTVLVRIRPEDSRRDSAKPSSSAAELGRRRGRSAIRSGTGSGCSSIPGQRARTASRGPAPASTSARGAGLGDVAVEGLCERFEPDELAELLKYAAEEGAAPPPRTRRSRRPPPGTSGPGCRWPGTWGSNSASTASCR